MPARSGQSPVPAAGAEQAWVSDFTYVATWAGFVYVAFVIDADARRMDDHGGGGGPGNCHHLPFLTISHGIVRICDLPRLQIAALAAMPTGLALWWSRSRGAKPPCT